LSELGADPHIYLGEPDEDLIDDLEPDQLVSATEVAVARRRFGPGGRTGLWALRSFVLLMTLLMVYAFIAQIASGRP